MGSNSKTNCDRKHRLAGDLCPMRIKSDSMEPVGRICKKPGLPQTHKIRERSWGLRLNKGSKEGTKDAYWFNFTRTARGS